MKEVVEFIYWKEEYGFTGTEIIETNHHVTKVRDNLDELAKPYLEENSAVDGIIVEATYFEENEEGSEQLPERLIEVANCKVFKEGLRDAYGADSHTYHIGIEEMKDAFIDKTENLDKEALDIAIEYQAFLLKNGIRADVSENYKKNNPEIEEKIAETDLWTKFMDEYNRNH